MRKLLFIALAFAFSLSTQAQYLELGFTGGATSYMGDLQQSAPSLGSFVPSGGLFARYHFSPRLAVKLMGLYAGFHATDLYASGSRRYRNLEAKTSIYEASLTGELNLLKFDILDGHTVAPYVSAGVAGFYFNPQGHYNGTWVDLQPLGTEGQTLEGGKPYSKIAIAIPVGIGTRFALSRKVNIGFEFGFRYALTDYLDDVSGVYPDIAALAKQNPTAAEMSYRTPILVGSKLENPAGQKRGDKVKNDYYYYAGATLSINLGSKEKMEFNQEFRNFLKPSVVLPAETPAAAPLTEPRQ
jgi:hypothetical protein